MGLVNIIRKNLRVIVNLSLPVSTAIRVGHDERMRWGELMEGTRKVTGAYLTALSILISFPLPQNSSKITLLFRLVQEPAPLRSRRQLPIYNTNRIILNLEGGRPQVRQVNCVFREEGLGLLVVDGGVDDDIIPLLPVDWGGDAVPITDLKS